MSVPLSPLEAMWSGILHAWAFVLGPGVALMAGTIMGLFAADWTEAGVPVGAVATFGTVAIPMAMFGTTFGQLLAIITAIAVLGFWGSDRWRKEAWLTICLAAGTQTFILFAGECDLWQIVRIAIACTVAGGIYAAVTLYPIWRYGDRKKRRRKRRRVADRIRYRLTPKRP